MLVRTVLLLLSLACGRVSWAEDACVPMPSARSALELDLDGAAPADRAFTDGDNTTELGSYYDVFVVDGRCARRVASHVWASDGLRPVATRSHGLKDFEVTATHYSSSKKCPGDVACFSTRKIRYRFDGVTYQVVSQGPEKISHD